MALSNGVELLVLCALLASVQSAIAGSGRKDVCEGYVYDTQEHRFQWEEDDHCPTQFDAFQLEMENSYCVPRPILLRLNASRGYTYNPPAIMVQRCIGHCSGSEGNCKSARDALLKAQVTLQDISGTTTCGKVEVKHHLMCSCN